ncbi:MAG TPA: hypothetical protein VMO26_04170 [Vicinamibacterales bacterium]|nr:hypothetical protein [Vicinamibacterales bacterium]
MHQAYDARPRQTGTYALDTLHALPCGCVAAVYRTQPLDTEIVSLEARGPHCVYAHHETGRVLGLSTGEDARLSR